MKKTLIFLLLAAGEDSNGTLGRRDTFSSGWNQNNAIQAEREAPLDGRLLPFASSGPVTFGVGVNLKMAATRWTNWAADIGLRNDKGSPEEGWVALNIQLHNLARTQILKVTMHITGRLRPAP